MALPADLSREDFQIQFSEDKEHWTLRWTGSIHSKDPSDFLDPYFEDVLDGARNAQRRIRMDFTALEYMNSASLPPLIQFLRKVSEEKVHAEFLYDAKRKVQAASFRALEVIAKNSKYAKVTGV